MSSEGKQKLVDVAGLLGVLVLTYFGVGFLMTKIPLKLSAPNGDAGSGAGSPIPTLPVVPVVPVGRGKLAGNPITAFPGKTYFIAIQINGLTFRASSTERVKDEAQNRGFADVVVFKKGEQPREWPISSVGDYIVRGTYRGPSPKTFPRNNDIATGDVNLLEAFEA